MTDLIKIENVNHRLGNDPHYFLKPGDIALLFTPHDVEAARQRYERAIRRRPTVDVLFEPIQPEPEPRWTDYFMKILGFRRQAD